MVRVSLLQCLILWRDNPSCGLPAVAKNFQKLYADGEIFFHRFFFAQLCNVGRT